MWWCCSFHVTIRHINKTKGKRQRCAATFLASHLFLNKQNLDHIGLQDYCAIRITFIGLGLGLGIIIAMTIIITSTITNAKLDFLLQILVWLWCLVAHYHHYYCAIFNINLKIQHRRMPNGNNSERLWTCGRPLQCTSWTSPTRRAMEALEIDCDKTHTQHRTFLANAICSKLLLY